MNKIHFYNIINMVIVVLISNKFLGNSVILECFSTFFSLHVHLFESIHQHPIGLHFVGKNFIFESTTIFSYNF